MGDSLLFLTVKSAFDEEGWGYTEVPDQEVIQAGFEAHHTRVNLHVQAFPELPAVSVVSESAQTTDSPAKRERLAELVMRVNQTLTVGNFEMDWDAGRLIFRATNLFLQSEGDREIVRGLVHNAIGEMDRIAPFEVLIHQAEGAELASLDLVGLLSREDLLPEIESLPGQGGG